MRGITKVMIMTHYTHDVCRGRKAAFRGGWLRWSPGRLSAGLSAVLLLSLGGGSLAGASGGMQEMSKDELITIGKSVYQDQCIQCHKADGKGSVDTGPSLVGSEAVLGDRRAFKYTVLDGRHVEAFLMGAPGSPMESYAELSNEELAGVLTYVRNAWGNDDDGGDVIQPADVQDAR